MKKARRGNGLAGRAPAVETSALSLFGIDCGLNHNPVGLFSEYSATPVLPNIGFESRKYVFIYGLKVFDPVFKGHQF